MFDIGFSELIVIGLVALIVIGPERLPRVARTAGHLLGRLQRYVSDVKADINREIQLEELKKLQQQVAEQARSMEQSVNQELKSVETSLNESIAQGIGEKSDGTPVATSVPAADDAGVTPTLTLGEVDRPKV
jgi:sec-independent protein translocase protein TatB